MPLLETPTGNREFAEADSKGCGDVDVPLELYAKSHSINCAAFRLKACD
jgi:hypothetical protein